MTIGRLRRKLGEPQVIENTPGIGYRIRAAHPDAPGASEADASEADAPDADAPESSYGP